MKGIAMRFGSLLSVALLAPLLCLPARAADKQCRVVHAATLDMGTDETGGVVVPMSIGGKTVHLLVDTGGVVSMLTKGAVKSLGLPMQTMGGAYLKMFGGTRIDRMTTARDIDLGGLRTNTMPFAVMPDGWMPSGIDGTLAPDILSAYDAEFDFANNKFYLASQDHCRGQVVYWTQTGYTAIPMFIGNGGHISFNVGLDGKTILASLDTGSTRSLMSLEAARDEFGIDEKNPDLKALPGESGKSHGYHYPFKKLSLVGIAVSNPDLVLVPDGESKMMGPGGPRIILGMGILRQLHLYIAYGEATMYVTGATAH
jgi:predicted aspartyl protease